MPLDRSFALRETLESVHAPAFLPGGCGANMAAGLRTLGSAVSVVAPFGNDSYADYARRDLEARGVAIRGFDYGGPHSLIYTLITADRERTFADYCHGVPYDLLAPARLLDDEHIVAIDGYLLLRQGVAEGMRAWLTEPRPANQRLVFCPGDVSVLLDAKPIADLAIERCDHLVMNRNEAHTLFPGLSDEAIVAALRARGISGAVTKGEEGALLFNAHEMIHVPKARLDRPIVNTNGAGDAFTAGYLRGIDMDLPLAEIARIATACAAQILVIEGARPPLAVMAELAD
ncbi:carbohydrate kinase family protein [Sphingomonas sp. LB-2]|uniref:carbohydrate kinase family protein n=1 Tax=Sphingomonas caeni TaxID=2984949 RepID=UPI0022319013|nr:carbohydrate kinase family protein [Sphingomonas caeni]MCW3845715.1 carbohydrate kinase family protein [Sphingomonas caeni]